MRELFDFLPLSNKDPVPMRFTDDPKYVGHFVTSETNSKGGFV